jgi:DUF1009 family protein
MILPPDRPLAIIAGGGSVPLHVARAAEQAGRKTLVVGIEGEADADFDGFSYERFSWGQIGKLERLLSGHGARDVVIVGGVRVRPDFRLLTQLDMGTVKALPEIYAILRKGDNSVLTGVIRFIEARGYSVVGAHEVATDLVAPEGTLVGKPSAEQLADARLAIEAAWLIGQLDAGQAAVSVGERIVALEGAEGTDAMLERVALLRETRRVRFAIPGGALAKCSKPQQDLRVDMPTIGPDTVTHAKAAGLAGVAIEAGRVMIIDRAETVRRAEAAGFFIQAFAPQAPSP